MKNSKILARLNSEYSYFRVHITITSRVAAGWAITLVGLIKLWMTNDPAAWWPILMGGTGLMIISRGVDHFMDNKKEATELQAEMENPYKHVNMNDAEEEYESYAVKKHKEYQNNLPV